MTAPLADVVVRCRNEMPHTRRTLEVLAAQRGIRTRVLFLDCASSDGSREAAATLGARLHDIAPATYVPGAALNLGMRLTETAVVAFVNADAVPLDADALATLIEPFQRMPDLAATYARQVARPDADPVTRADYARAFADVAAVNVRHGSFFSMAASAVRRTAWEALPFDESLRYSEDADWTRRAEPLGWRALYVPGARFEHSHAYSLRAQHRRSQGEGEADTAIYRLDAPSLVGDLLRPLAGSLLRDGRAGLLRPREALVRLAQAAGRFSGRRKQRPVAKVAGPDVRAEAMTLCGDPAAEARVRGDLAQLAGTVAAALGPRLRTLALVGSYARGEGGAVAGPSGLGPYNDYDLVAVLSCGARSARPRLAVLGAELGRRLGVEVDLWAVDAAALRPVPRTLFWLNAALGGLRVLHGDARALAPLEELSPRGVPLDECARLLANRAVGLALSNLGDGGEEPMARHAHKAVLACGDALLLAADRYRPTLVQRLAELKGLAGAPAVDYALVERYSDAIEYRRRPDFWRPPVGETVSTWYAAARERIGRCHLAFESFRAQTPQTPQGYARAEGRLYTQLPDVRGTPALSAARAALARQAPLLPYLGHPRERLARVAVALAYGAADPGCRAIASRLLGIKSLTGAASDAALLGALRALIPAAG